MWKSMGYLMQDTAGTLDILWDDTFVCLFVCYIVNIACLSFANTVAGLQKSQSLIVRTLVHALSQVILSFTLIRSSFYYSRLPQSRSDSNCLFLQ
jgi:hypothetical protein